MSKNTISDMTLSCGGEKFSAGEKIPVAVSFSVRGTLRDAFNEKNWTEAYRNNDNTLKIKYTIKLRTGGIKKRTVGEVDSYRKASIFWTRNPKLVNPMKEKRVWVQVAKNFTPYIRLTEQEVREELLDFNETVHVAASELGSGTHQITAAVSVSWQKHDYADAEKIEGSSTDVGVKVI